MKYDSSIVGEKVINAAGKEGTIISVSRDGAVTASWARLSNRYLLDKMNSLRIRIRSASLKLSARP